VEMWKGEVGGMGGTGFVGRCFPVCPMTFSLTVVLFAPVWIITLIHVRTAVCKTEPFVVFHEQTILTFRNMLN